MTPEMATDVLRQTLWVCVEISAPLLIVAMVIGLGISIFQSVTQINEMTLSFVPKAVVFCLVLGILFPWMLKTLVRFTNELLVHQWDKLVSSSAYAS